LIYYFSLVFLRDEHQVLLPGKHRLLPLLLQQIRLHRHQRQRLRNNHKRLLSGRLVRHLCAQIAASLARLQSHSVLDVTAQSRRLPDKQHALDHQLAVPALSVHSHLCAARHAAVRRHVELRGGHAARQLRHLRRRHAHRVPDNYGRGLERGDVLRHSVEGWRQRLRHAGELLLHSARALRQLHAAECVPGDCR